MLNRIRRAASLTRERYFPKGRHRRPLPPSRSLAVPASAASADAATVVLGQASASAVHRRPLRGEDVALARREEFAGHAGGGEPGDLRSRSGARGA